MFITDLAPTRSGGGSYVVNWNIREQLRRHFRLQAPPPIVPNVSPWEKFLSRVNRYVLKHPGNFFYFSRSTMGDSAERASRYFCDDADGIFFRSATRWCHCRPEVPYFVYLDVVFQTFFENTFDPADFLASDLRRIFRCEAGFLEGASAVFFESNWGLQKAKEAYNLAGRHYYAANRGGVLDPPEADVWSDEGPFLLSVAKNFEQKGGDIVLSAFRRLKKRFPGLRWHIIGGRPTGDWQSVDGIEYEGVLNPDRREDMARLRHLFSKAFLLVHPTREDTNPLVITEAAYFGCPAISVNRFAVPELVLDGKTGILLGLPVGPDQLADSISHLIEDRDGYLSMRQAARQYAMARFQWDRIGEEIAARVNECLP